MKCETLKRIDFATYEDARAVYLANKLCQPWGYHHMRFGAIGERCSVIFGWVHPMATEPTLERLFPV